MNRLALFAIALSTTFSGCVVAPGPAGYDDVSASVYVAPTYESPGPGWVWQRHPRYGWGWHHREHGWHRGWR